MDTMASQITSLTLVYTTVYSGADQRKHQSPASLAFVWGIHRWPVNSPHKWPVTRKMFSLDDVIMIDRECAHGFGLLGFISAVSYIDGEFCKCKIHCFYADTGAITWWIHECPSIDGVNMIDNQANSLSPGGTRTVHTKRYTRVTPFIVVCCVQILPSFNYFLHGYLAIIGRTRLSQYLWNNAVWYGLRGHNNLMATDDTAKQTKRYKIIRIFVRIIIRKCAIEWTCYIFKLWLVARSLSHYLNQY